jgi:hypothetical protein
MTRLILFLERNHRSVVFLILLLTFVAGVAYSLHLGDKLRYADEREYVTLAKNLVHHGTYSYNGTKPTAFRPPGYPFLISSVFMIHESIPLARIVNFLILVLSLLMLSRLAHKYGSPLAGILVVTIGGFGSPILFYTTSTFYPQVFSAFLLILILFLLFHHEGRWRYPLSGAVFGLLVLTVPSFIFTLLFACAWLVWFQGGRGVARVAVMLLAFTAVMTPWAVRNYAHFHSVPFVCTNGGRALLIGNSPYTRAIGVNTLDLHYFSQSRGMGEIEKDKMYRNEALSFIAANPREALDLYLLKFINYFNYSNKLATEGESSGTKTLLAFLSYVPLLAVGIVLRVLFIRSFPLNRLEQFMIALYILNGAFAAIFFTRVRLRVPFDFLLVAVASMYLSTILKHYVVVARNKVFRPTIAPAS